MYTFTAPLTEVVKRYSKALIGPVAQAAENFLDDVDSPNKFGSVCELVTAYICLSENLANLANPDTAGAAIKKLCSEGSGVLLVPDSLTDEMYRVFTEAGVSQLDSVDFVILVEDDETGEYVGTINKKTITEAL